MRLPKLRVKRSHVGFLFMVILCAFGAYLAILSGIHAETSNPETLYMVGATIALSLAGIFAQAWAKYQEEERRAQLASKYQAEEQTGEKIEAKAPVLFKGVDEKFKAVWKLFEEIQERALKLGIGKDEILSILVYFLSIKPEEREEIAEKLFSD